MRTKQPIAIDFHGVLFNVRAYKAALAHELFNVYISPHRYFREYVIGRHLSQEQYEVINQMVYESEDAFAVQPFPKALEYLKLIQKEREAVVVTRQYDRGLSVVRQIADKYKLGVEIYGLDLNKVDRTTKLDVLHRLGISIMLDDTWRVIEPMINNIQYPIWFDPFIRKTGFSRSGYKRVCTWPRAYDMISALP